MSKKIEVFLYNKIFLMLGLNFGYLNLSKEKNISVFSEIPFFAQQCELLCLYISL